MDKQENSLIPKEDDTGEALGAMLKTILNPLISSMAQLLKNNTEAIQNIAEQQRIQSERMERLEEALKWNTLVTPAQVRFINGAIKNRAREVLSKKNLQDDPAAIKTVAAAIRKAVLSRYGVPAMHDIPKHEYPVVMQQISQWTDLLILLDAAKKARNRADLSEEKAHSGLVDE